MYRQAELIAEVKKKPTLWDAQYKHGADKDLRDMQWIEVAKVLFPDWETMELADRNEKLYEIKRRWKNIRDYYRKESKKWKGKRYMYKDLLKFLDTPPSDEANCSEIIVKEEVSLSMIDQFNQETLGGNEEISYADTRISAPAPAAQYLNPTKTQEIPAFGEEEPAPPMKRRREDDETIDEDKSFLLSLLPEMRKLNGRQKIDFKISVLNDLRVTRYSESYFEIKEENSQ